MDVDAVEVTGNPAALESGAAAKETTFGDMEKALAGLKDGSVSEAEVVRTMEAAMDSKMAQLKSEITQPTLLRPVVKAITSKFSESPTNWFADSTRSCCSHMYM